MRLTDVTISVTSGDLRGGRLPGAIFDYIEGGADDEASQRRNPRLRRLRPGAEHLRGVREIDLSVTVMGQKLLRRSTAAHCVAAVVSPSGERAVGAAAAKFGTMFGVSSIGTVSLGDLRKAHATPQCTSFIFTAIEA